MYSLSALEHWECGYKITLKSCMYVCSVSIFVLPCVGGNFVTGGSSIHGPSMQFYQMPVSKIHKPCKWEAFGHSKTEIQL